MTFLARDSLRLLALYAAACGAAWFFLRWYQPQVLGPLSTALLAVPLTMAAGYGVAAREHLQEQRRVLGAARQTVFRDGERVVVRGPSSRIRDYWGLALCPSAVETPSGPVRILGWPSLETLVEVCATGTYSAALRALLPGGSGPSRLRLSTFTPELWASENRDSAYTYLLWGAVFAVVAVGSALATRWC